MRTNQPVVIFVKTISIGLIIAAGMFVSFQIVGYKRYSVEGVVIYRGFPFKTHESIPFYAYAGDEPPAREDLLEYMDIPHYAHPFLEGIILNVFFYGLVGVIIVFPKVQRFTKKAIANVVKLTSQT